MKSRACGTSAEIRVTRNGVVESVHRVGVTVTNVEGGVVAVAGDPQRLCYFRSAAKPFQALPLVADGVVDALGITSEELALCCASHNAESRHLELARALLARAGLDEEALECGPHPPLRDEEARRLDREGRSPTPLHNNCSGKHAGMLALAVHHDWGPKGYVRPDHPVQRRILSEMSEWCGVPEVGIERGTDGCGVPSFAVPLRVMARSFARLAQAAEESGTAAARVVGAMTDHPFAVAGTGRLCTEVMKVAGERVVVKTGAEGVYCAALRGRRLGVALKVEDGSRRASDAALVRVLELLDALRAEELDGPLESFRRRPIRNTLGDVVGAVEADFDLGRPSG